MMAVEKFAPEDREVLIQKIRINASCYSGTRKGDASSYTTRSGLPAPNRE